MKPTIETLEKISQNSARNKDEVFTRLYRYLLRPDIYFIAYKNLYANSGAGTKGVNNDTADGFSEDKVEQIIQSLKDNSYSPKPSRRTYIKKENGRLRPLGIPTFSDKLVQEVLRMVLEAVYEPIFSTRSHGFRPGRSCHTALKDVKHQFHGTRWFVEGDIKGCFDNIDHTALINLVNMKIKDARLIQLLHKFLKAGYMEDWRYNNTYSGAPQGGIVSPILSNIYLHELDKFVDELALRFEKPSDSKYTPEYEVLRRKVESMRRKIKNASIESRPALVKEMKSIRAILLRTPSKSHTDKKIKYIRYADDFLIGVNGSKEDCEWIKSELSTFISEFLKMELSQEKTLITHSETPARFLGYDVRVRRNSQIKRSGSITKRTLSNMTELNVPLQDKIEKFLFTKRIVKLKNGALSPISRGGLVNLTDLEILSAYNAELRGLCNYYNLASNYHSLHYFAYLMEYSCLKTLAAKHKSSIAKIKNQYNDRHGSWCIPYETKTGTHHMYFAKYQDCKTVKQPSDNKDNLLAKHINSRSTFEDRLKAKLCELCGSTDSKHYEIHHVNKVKNLSGKTHWERVMISKRRKTIVVCRACHHSIHET